MRLPGRVLNGRDEIERQGPDGCGRDTADDQDDEGGHRPQPGA